MTTGYFFDINVKREAIARYGLTVKDVQEIIQSAIGGMNLTTTVEGRERYPVNVRYFRDMRSDPEDIKRILVPVMEGPAPADRSGNTTQTRITQVPLGELADIKIVKGPTAIKSEEGLLTSYVYIDFSGRDVGGYVDEAKKKISSLKIPEGYRLQWSGEYEYLVQTHERLKTGYTVHPVRHHHPHLFQYKVLYENGDSLACRAIFTRRIFLAAVSARLQHEHRSMGRHNSTGRPRCRNRRRNAPLP